MKKNFDFEHSFKTLNRSTKGIQTESGAVLSDAGQLRGFVKGQYAGIQYGLLDADFQTDPSQESKLSFRFNKFAPGLGVNLFASTKDKNRVFKKAVAGVDLDYSQEFITTAVTTKSDGQVHTVDASATLGYNGVSVGGSVAADLTSGAVLTEKNVGGEFLQNDFAVSFWTEKNLTLGKLGYMQQISRAHILGAVFNYELTGAHARSMSVSSEYKLDAATIAKAKLDLPTGDVSAAITHRLADPRALVSLSAAFNAKAQRFNPDKIGVQLSFGDF